MRRPSLPATLRSTEFFGVMLFVFAVLFPPFDDLAEVNLSVHMLQHVTIIVAGAIIAYPLFRKGALRPRPGWKPKAVLLASAAAIVFWHVPSFWDAAVLNPFVHMTEHLSFLLVGLAVGSFLQVLSDSVKIGALFAAFFGHMTYAAILVAPWNVQVYPLFSTADQGTLGWIMLLTGWTFLVGVAYIIRRNPDWLQGFSAGGARPAVASPGMGRRKVPSWSAPVASGVLILALAIYFAVTGVALASANSARQIASVVYIVETPITWDYSPQSIVVVMGVNNTVTWISHSTSYDTVTSNAGQFDSGPIRPGGMFSYTFSTAGVYPYHCLFHPWMQGSVTVLQ